MRDVRVSLEQNFVWLWSDESGVDVHLMQSSGVNDLFEVVAF
jgi:hypothetical protein